jgi:hypothetical protein
MYCVLVVNQPQHYMTILSVGHKFYEWKRIHIQQKRISDGRWGGQGGVGGGNEK